MSYDWQKIYKTEEYYERSITDDVVEHICSYYGIEEILDLTEEQYFEIQSFREKLNEYSVMQIGYSNVCNEWESEKL